MGRKAVSILMEMLAVAFTAVLLAAAAVSWRASFVSPESGPLWASVAMGLPVILALNFAALIWWACRRRWFVALMPLAALAMNLGYLSAMVRLPDFDAPGPHDLRVATLNTFGLRRSGSTAATARALAAMVRREGVDVVCLQEFPDGRDFPADSIVALFAPRLPYSVYHAGQAIVSRFPIDDHRYAKFPDSGNDYLQADLRIGEDTVRVYSLHLQTSGISSLRQRFRKDYNRMAPVERVIGELERNSRIRAQQVRAIREAIDSTRYPVIVAGDFNDTPSSYTYRKLKGDLRDGFRDAGGGFAGTFRYLGGVLRIDYIFYDDRFEGVSYYMPADDLSDHRAVVAALRFNR